MKTLVCILNYNTPEITTKLYKSLKSYQRSDYDLFIIDNGSDPDKEIINKGDLINLNTNLRFGGALNYAFDIIQRNEQYDSLLFMNSDLIVTPEYFVKSLRDILITEGLKIVSPSIIQLEGQCHWRQMHQWHSNGLRFVKWVDFQCPMFSRKFIETINQYDSILNYGWGNDVYSGMICEDNSWCIGVCDSITAIHLDGYTTKKYKHLEDYNKIAEQNMFQYFSNNKLMNKFFEYRYYAENYSYSF